MPILSDEIAEQVEKQLAGLAGPVRLVMITGDSECQFCQATRQLVEEVSQLSDEVTAEIYDFADDGEKAQELGVDKVPAIAVIGGEDYGIRFYGIPSGYEFASFLSAINLAATGELGLSEETVQALAEVDELVHIQVFVTPTCPYCQMSVVLAHQMAAASSMVRADMVEATEFPELAMKYEVKGVPRTVINEVVHIEGAVPEATVLEKLQEALAGGEGAE